MVDTRNANHVHPDLVVEEPGQSSNCLLDGSIDGFRFGRRHTHEGYGHVLVLLDCATPPETET